MAYSRVNIVLDKLLGATKGSTNKNKHENAPVTIAHRWRQKLRKKESNVGWVYTVSLLKALTTRENFNGVYNLPERAGLKKLAAVRTSLGEEPLVPIRFQELRVNLRVVVDRL